MSDFTIPDANISPATECCAVTDGYVAKIFTFTVLKEGEQTENEVWLKMAQSGIRHGIECPFGFITDS